MTGEKYVIGYIGFGRAVRQYHLPYTYQNSEVEVRYIYRREADRVLDPEGETDYPGVRFVTEMEPMLGDPELDVVVVCSPNATHPAYARQLLEAGKHCIIEKPFAPNAAEAAELFSMAGEKGLCIMPNQNRRYDGDFLTLKSVLDRGVLGEVLELESHYDYYNPKRDVGSFRYLLGLGVHTIDQMISLNGIPDRIVYDVRGLDNPGGCDDYFDLDLFYGRKKVTVKTSYYVKISSPRFIVHGTKGSLVLPQRGHLSLPGSLVLPQRGHLSLPGGLAKAPLRGDLSYFDETDRACDEKVDVQDNQYYALYQAFFRAISGKGEKPVQNHEVIKVLEILEDGLKAAKSC